jgi:hypothetical protein
VAALLNYPRISHLRYERSNCQHVPRKENIRCNTVGFLPEVWSPLQATGHLCGIFCLSWHINTQVQGTTVFSLIRQTLFVFTTLYVPWLGSYPCTAPSRIVRPSMLTTRPAGQDHPKEEKSYANTPTSTFLSGSFSLTTRGLFCGKHLKSSLDRFVTLQRLLPRNTATSFMVLAVSRPLP